MGEAGVWRAWRWVRPAALGWAAALTLAMTAGSARAAVPEWRKVVVHAFEPRGDGLEALADTLTRAVVQALNTQARVCASSIHGAAQPTSTRFLTAGELGRRVGEATGAQFVIQGVLLRPVPGGDAVLLSACGYDTVRQELQLLDPLQSTYTVGQMSTAGLERAVGDYLARACQHWCYPDGELAELTGGGDRQVLRLRLRTPLPSTGGLWQLFALPTGVVAEQVGERFAAAPRFLGAASLLRGEGGSAWLDAARTGLDPGARVVLAPPGELPTSSTGPGVVVTSRPRGAVVSVNGEVVGATPLWLTIAGRRQLTLQMTHPAAALWRGDVDAGARQAGLVQALLPVAGAPTPAKAARGVSMRVDSDPAGAEVLVDGVARGLTPLTVDGVEGRPTVTVRREGYRTWEAQFTASGPLTVKAELVPEYGGLEISSRPAGCEVKVDGRKMGCSPVRLTGVPTGRHEIQAKSSDGRVFTKEVFVASGRADKVEFDFDEPAPPSDQGEDTVLPAEGPAKSGPPAPSAGSGAKPPVLKCVLWQHKLKLGRSQGLHLVVGPLVDQGAMVSLTLNPPKGYTGEQIGELFKVTYLYERPVPSCTWAIDGLPELRCVQVERTPDKPCRLQVRLKLAAGVVAKVDPSSNLLRLRIVLRHRSQ